MNGTQIDSWRLWKGPVLVWGALIALFAVNTALAYLHLGAFNTAFHLLLAAAMIALLVMFLMDLRHSSTLLRLFAGAGLFWSVFMFALTFADYATRHY